MKVTLLNPEQVKDLFKNWSITSSVCYGSTINPDNPEAIGKHCMKSSHFSGSRGDYIKFRVDDVPRFEVDQAVRHEIGVFKNVASFRYISKNDFRYSAPVEIFDNQELFNRYNEHMDNTMELYSDIQEYVYKKTGSHERSNESARYVLPISTHTSFVIGYTIEAFIHLCNSRLCVRAEDIIREMTTLMKQEVLKILPELENELVPNCVKLMYCPEGKSGCGAYPTKKQVQEYIKLGKKAIEKETNNA